MGFCLFEELEMRDFFVAVNAGCVSDVVPAAKPKYGYIYCDLKLDLPNLDRPIQVIGAEKDINEILQRAAKIGVSQVQLQTIGGRMSSRPTPFLLNQTARVGFAREMTPEEFSGMGEGFVTASRLYLTDGQSHLITQRPGSFAYKANAGGNVPYLKIENTPRTKP